MPNRPPASSEAIRKTMRSTKATGTGPELALRRAILAAGIRGYRVNYKKLPGKPDIVFVGKRVAIFVNGCFWHGCPHCSSYRTPKTNSEFWKAKLEENQERDQRALFVLEQLGFTTLVVWECQIEKNLPRLVEEIHGLVQDRDSSIPKHYTELP